MIASPMPSAVPERPAWSATVVPWTVRPNSLATLPRAATTPNCPNPEAKAASTTPMTTGSTQRWRRRAGTASDGGPDGDTLSPLPGATGCDPPRTVRRVR